MIVVMIMVTIMIRIYNSSLMISNNGNDNDNGGDNAASAHRLRQIAFNMKKLNYQIKESFGLGQFKGFFLKHHI